MALFACIGTMLVSCGDDHEESAPKSQIKVSPSVEMLGEERSTTTITVNAPANTTWTISGAPDWLSFNRSGLGSTTVVVTATQENFSDEPREAHLVFTTDDGKSSAACTVNQKGVLAANCRVHIPDMTVMSDGFAGDLSFDSNCKGYKEAFFIASALPSLTERDVFYALMEEPEYRGSLDYFTSPYISPEDNPQADIVYCIAAYGSETNADGSHKYGPITMKRVKTKPMTRNCDMWMTFTYSSTQWKVVTSRQGSYGQKCDYYYYIAGEGESASGLFNDWMVSTDAYFCHFYFKPAIEKNADAYFLNGPQTLNFTRTSDKFCCITWGTNKDNGEFSSELRGVWYPTDLSSPAMMKNGNRLNVNANGSIPFTRKFSSKSEMPKFETCIVNK